MSNILLHAAGTLAMISAIGHNYLGATKVVGPSKSPNRSAKRLMHVIWFLSGVYWFAAGIMLLVTPLLFDGETRKWIVLGCVAVLGYAGLLNLLVMRGRHFGGYLLALVVALALAGM